MNNDKYREAFESDFGSLLVNVRWSDSVKRYEPIEDFPISDAVTANSLFTAFMVGAKFEYSKTSALQEKPAMSEDRQQEYFAQIEREFDEWVKDEATHWNDDLDAAWQAWRHKQEEVEEWRSAAESEAKLGDQARAELKTQTCQEWTDVVSILQAKAAPVAELESEQSESIDSGGEHHD